MTPDLMIPGLTLQVRSAGEPAMSSSLRPAVDQALKAVRMKMGFTMSLIGLAAGASAGPAQAPRVRDSAGVTIVTNKSIARALPTITIAAAPFLDLGGLRDNADEELTPRNIDFRVLTLAGGTVVVADGTHLKFFAPTGRLARAVGGKGGGPGEYSSLDDVCRIAGDTILAISGLDHRVTVYSKSGNIVFTRPIPPDAAVPYGGCFGDGSLVVQLGSSRGQSTLDPVGDFIRIRPDGTRLNRLGTWPVSMNLGLMRTVSIIAHGRSVFVADGKTAEVREYAGSTGNVVRIIRIEDRPPSYTDADYEMRIKASVPSSASPSSVLRIRQMMDSWPRPATWPVFARMFVDGAGRIWLAEYPHAKIYPEKWLVLDTNGGVIGRLEMPEQAEREAWHLTAVEPGSIVISRRDADGATHLSFFALRLPTH